jgi:hypothetical protein
MDSSDWLNGIRYHIFGTRSDTEFKLKCTPLRNSKKLEGAQVEVRRELVQRPAPCPSMAPLGRVRPPPLFSRSVTMRAKRLEALT